MLEQTAQCRSWGDVPGLQQKLLTQSLQGIAEEISACTETALLLSRLGAKHVEEAGHAASAGTVAQTIVEEPKATTAKAA